MQTVNAAGIYLVTCDSNGATYVGQSISMKSRWYDHKKRLKAGKHYNCNLQNAYNKYGSDSFSYSVALYCKQENLSLYEQLVADGLKGIGVRLFNIGSYLPSPAKGSKRPDNSARLLMLHSNLDTKEMMLRGLRERSARIKGTPEAIAMATHASRSRVPKPLDQRKTKPAHMILKAGSPEHSAMLSVLWKQMYADGRWKPNYSGKSVMRLDTGEKFISETAIAKSLGVTKQAIYHQLNKGSGVCKGVPIAYIDTGAQGVKK